jgi:modulator of FtsH protease
VTDQLIVEQWQPFFMTLAGASAALAGLVFVAMSLHPREILSQPVMRARAFASAFGFLVGVTLALIMLLPARTAPFGSVLLIVVGVGVAIVIAYRQFLVRNAGASILLVIIGDLLAFAPIPAGIVGLLKPDSDVPFVILAIAAGVGILVLFAQSWTLVLHSITNETDPGR